MIRVAIQEGVRVLDKKVVIEGQIEIVVVKIVAEHIEDIVRAILQRKIACERYLGGGWE